MTDEFILKKGYTQYKPTVYDNEHIVARFQKRFDDEHGKKYFISVLKWSNAFVPEERRDEWWEPYSYEYEVKVSMYREENLINLHFHTDWSLDRVEEFMAEYFKKMRPNYYELWDGQRRVRAYEED